MAVPGLTLRIIVKLMKLLLLILALDLVQPVRQWEINLQIFRCWLVLLMTIFLLAVSLMIASKAA